jgi:type I restriction enzyme S subunit
MNSLNRTEVGAIPHNWVEGTLGDAVSALQAGVSVNSTADDVTHGVPAILKTSCVASGAFFPHESKAIAPEDRNRAILNPRRDSILISRMNTIDLVGECGFVDRDYPELFIPDRLWMTRFRPSAAVSPRWLTYVLSSETYRGQLQSIATGTSGSMKNIAKASLLDLPVAYPPLPEQQAIAEALSDVDGLLDALDALIAKKRAIKQSAMQQLLTGKARLQGFSGDWEMKRLGELAQMGSGGTPITTVTGYYDGDVPWVSISDMTRAGKFITATERNLTRAGLAHSAAQMFAAGTVLYAMYASLGECSIAAISLCTSQAILGIRTGDNLNNEFLYYYLTSIKPLVKALGQHGTQANLNKGMVQDFRLSVPSDPEQLAIVGVLSDMDAEIAALEARRDKTRAIKQGMMQQLLTGRVRLVKPTPPEVST